MALMLPRPRIVFSSFLYTHDVGVHEVVPYNIMHICDTSCAVRLDHNLPTLHLYRCTHDGIININFII